MAAEMTPPAAAPDFLTRSGWDNARIEPLAGDASFRRYFRVIDGSRRAVLMDAPPPHEDPRAFLSIARQLCAQGFAAPAILAEDLFEGLVLLEDFGDARMREMIDTGSVDETETYAATVALLAELHRHPPATVPPYSRSELHREAGLLTDWYCPAVGLNVDVESYRTAWDVTFDRIDDARLVTVLRDYHAENIMLREGLSGHARLGLLDFQDALVGHPAYDLVSMLQDARRDVPIDIETKMLVEYQRLAQPGPAFLDSYAILGGQRNAKIVGIFTRLWQRDGKPRYLDFLPRVWSYLERDLAHPALAEVRAWFDANIPADKRGGYLKEPA